MVNGISDSFFVKIRWTMVSILSRKFHMKKKYLFKTARYTVVLPLLFHSWEPSIIYMTFEENQLFWTKNCHFLYSRNFFCLKNFFGSPMRLN